MDGDKAFFGNACFKESSDLTHTIEQSFQNKEKYRLVQIDITAAYDTVWHKGLYLKLLKLIPDLKLVRFIMLLIQERYFFVTTSDGQKSRTRRLPNGLPQGSVLAPTLFNICTADMPSTRSTKLLYADDSALGFTHQNKGKIEEALQSDLNTICTYYQKWHLKISTTKTVCSFFHLSTIKVSEKLKIMYNGSPLGFEKEPTYLGVTLDRSLTFTAHICSVRKKVQQRVNLLRGVQLSTL